MLLPGLESAMKQAYVRLRVIVDRLESSATRASQSQIHSHNHRRRVPQTITFGVFDCEFGFDSQEWSCSYSLRIIDLLLSWTIDVIT